jgi:PilZ domain
VCALHTFASGALLYSRFTGGTSLTASTSHWMTENRASPRVRTLKGASIVFGGSTVDCVVRNLSETGACLEVASPVGIPDDFTLQIKSEPTKRDCHVVWRSANRIGAYFK